MGKFIGGPNDGKFEESNSPLLNQEYRIVKSGSEDFPQALYKREARSGDLQYIKQFDSFDEYEAWCIVNVEP